MTTKVAEIMRLVDEYLQNADVSSASYGMRRKIIAGLLNLDDGLENAEEIRSLATVIHLLADRIEEGLFPRCVGHGWYHKSVGGDIIRITCSRCCGTGRV